MKSIKYLSGSLSLLVAAFLFGLYGVISRIIGIDFGAIYQVVARDFIILVVMLIYFLITRSWKKIEKKDYVWFLFMIVPGFIAVVAFFLTFNLMPISLAYFLFYAVSTVASYLWGFLLFKERFTMIKIFSLVICLLGLYFLFINNFSNLLFLPIILACVAGFGSACWNIISKKISHKYPLSQIITVDSLVVIFSGLPIILLFKQDIFLPSFTLPWLGILIYALVALSASFFTIYGFRFQEAQKGSLILLFEPVFGSLMGWLLFKESLGLLAILGATLILLGSSLPNLNFNLKRERIIL